MIRPTAADGFSLLRPPAGCSQDVSLALLVGGSADACQSSRIFLRKQKMENPHFVLQIATLYPGVFVQNWVRRSVVSRSFRRFVG